MNLWPWEKVNNHGQPNILEYQEISRYKLCEVQPRDNETVRKSQQ